MQSTHGLRDPFERVTRVWWVYVILLLLFFIPAYSSTGYDPRQSADLIESVLRNPLIHAVSPAYAILKLLSIVVILLLIVFGNRLRWLFNSYISLLLIAVAIFQNTARTDAYGLTIIISNVVYMIIVALFWIRSLLAGADDYSVPDAALWKWPAFVLAFFAFLYPVDEIAVTPDFNPLYLVSNASMVTGCMVLPVALAVLVLYYPRVDPSKLRMTAFVGTVFGTVNVLMWFLLKPVFWWMGVVHIPLLAISVLCFVLAFVKTGR